jgi:iron complex transport system permease protein
MFSSRRFSRPWELLVYLAPLPLLVGSLFVGPSENVRPADVLHWFHTQILSSGAAGAGLPSDPVVEAVILQVRMPRVILAFLVGAALTVSGSALQAFFRNPLVSPYILGLSSGSAFGAALALTAPFLPLLPSAFLFGLLAVGASYYLAVTREGVSTLSLILAGIIVTGVFTALLTIVQYLTDPFKLQTIVHWTMGNLHNANWAKVRSAALPILCGILWLYLLRWRMNVISLGDEETRAVGLNPQRERLLVLLPATLVASAAVAVAGVIGMVGLAVPHMVRMLVGPDNRKVQPVSFTLGGCFLVLVDDVSRTVASFEIPIGVFTVLVGGPFFVYLLKRGRMSYGGT